MSERLAILRPPADSLAARVRSLQEQIAQLSHQQVEDLVDAIARACALATEVSANPAQPPGVRDLARRLVEDEEARAATIRAVAARRP